MDGYIEIWNSIQSKGTIHLPYMDIWNLIQSSIQRTIALKENDIIYIIDSIVYYETDNKTIYY